MSRTLPGIVLAICLLPVAAIAAEPTVPYDDASVELGKRLFQIHCPSCHGRDAKARIDFVADATDLTAPSRYRNGSTPADLFRSLSDGAGSDMPPFQYTLVNEDDRWHLIHFIISTWAPGERAAFLGESND